MQAWNYTGCIILTKVVIPLLKAIVTLIGVIIGFFRSGNGIVSFMWTIINYMERITCDKRLDCRSVDCLAGKPLGVQASSTSSGTLRSTKCTAAVLSLGRLEVEKQTRKDTLHKLSHVIAGSRLLLWQRWNWVHSRSPRAAGPTTPQRLMLPIHFPAPGPTPAASPVSRTAPPSTQSMGSSRKMETR